VLSPQLSDQGVSKYFGNNCSLSFHEPLEHGLCGYDSRSHYSGHNDDGPNGGSNHSNEDTCYNDIRNNSPSNEDAMGASNVGSNHSSRVSAIPHN